MPPVLADVNVWLATLVASHPHHETAVRWWREAVLPAGDRVAFCRLTQLGLLRLLSNERVMGRQRLSHRQAWRTVTGLAEQPRVDLLVEPHGIDGHLAELRTRERFASGFWSDAYLAAFARAGGHRLATFDRGFRRFSGIEIQLLAGRAGALC